jgi:hypothetical protein
MNKLEKQVLEEMITRKIIRTNRIPVALCEALDCTENSLEDGILTVLNDKAYIERNDLELNIDAIDTVLKYGRDKELDLEFGFSSILESYVISTISEIIEIDLLEWM